jgi:predicted HAD superfamily Cof-like phosphohydrolase
MFPAPGTPEHEKFMRAAVEDPNSLEARIVKKAIDDERQKFEADILKRLQLMQALVPGQLFRDVHAFHIKFGIEPTTDPVHSLTDDVLKFRIQFMLEELREYMAAVGFYTPDGRTAEVNYGKDGSHTPFNPESALDALVDLCYVALGTAYLHRFIYFNEAWARVQEKNMQKVRAESAEDPLSTRGHHMDVVKPLGWKPASLVDLLDEVCPNCANGAVGQCESCKGLGRRRRVAPKAE